MAMRAPCLPQGGVIGFCSPSHVAERGRYARIEAGIRALGFQVREGDNLYRDTYGYLATPEERAADFHQLLYDEDVRLIFFGGGEGGNELLPLLDFDAIRRHPKRMASFSDGTTLLCAIWAKTGLETYYGPSPSCFEALTEYDRGQFLHHLVLDDAACHRPAGPWHTLVPGQAEGILVGGYTRNFALLLGSPYFPCSLEEKHILFLEDHQQFGGVDYVSAMISHMEQSGFMASVTGVLFGHYAPTPPPELLARLTRLGEKYGIPVAYCDDFGHGENHAVLPIGRAARLDTQAQTLRYL